MLANDVILKVRDRLRDNDFLNGTKFSDNHLIDALNDSGRDITRALKLNIKTYAAVLNAKNKSLRIPSRVIPCALIKVLFNGKQIHAQTHAYTLENPSEIMFFNPKPYTYSIHPFCDGKLEVYVSVWDKVESPSDFLSLSDDFSNVLVYGVLAQLFQIETNEGNLQRVTFYQQMFIKEMQNMQALLYSSTTPQVYKTPFNFF